MAGFERFEDPEAVFRVATEAFRAQDYRKSAECCDPVSLAVFRHEHLARLTPRARRSLSVDELLRVSPDWSRERAEFEVRILERDHELASQVRQLLAGVESLEEATALTPVEFFARALEARDTRWAVMRSLQEFASNAGETAAASIPTGALARLNAPPEFTVLGTVADGDRLAHVVFRAGHGFESPGGDGVSDPSVFTSVETNAARRQPDGSWLLVGGAEYLGTNGFSLITMGFDETPIAPEGSSA